jgi:hypothetical protein
MLNKPVLVLGETPESQLANLTKVLSIYGAILNNHKIYNDAVKLKMKQHINSLQSNAIFTANQQHIWSKLAEK